MQFKALAIVAFLPTAFTAPALLHRRDGWSIRDFSRDCSDPNICTYKFGIDVGDGSTPTACTVVDQGNPATNQSFYAVPCKEETPFSISWGWDYQDDFTVMTVVNTTSQMEAFFGYNDPNAKLPAANFTDVGPNTPQHT